MLRLLDLWPSICQVSMLALIAPLDLDSCLFDLKQGHVGPPRLVLNFRAPSEPLAPVFRVTGTAGAGYHTALNPLFQWLCANYTK